MKHLLTLRRSPRLRSVSASAPLVAPLVALLAALLAAPLAALLTAGAARPQPVQDVESTREALSKWVDTERVLSKERAEWVLGRQVLSDRVELVQREIDAIGARMADAQKSIADADSKRAELLAENDRLKVAGAGLAESIVELEASTAQLLPRLPAPVLAIIQPLTQALPEASATTKLGLGARFQNVVGILNQIDRFHRQISVSPEVRTLSDGRTAEVAALYLGVSQGYFATLDGLSAGVGTTTPNGWVWTPADDAAPEIAAAISILKNESTAAFVRLPIRVQ